MKKDILEQKVGEMTDEQFNLVEKLVKEDMDRQCKCNMTTDEYVQLCIDATRVVRRLN